MTRKRRSFVNIIHLLCFLSGVLFLNAPLHAQEAVTQIDPEIETKSSPTETDTKSDKEAAPQAASSQETSDASATSSDAAEPETAAEPSDNKEAAEEGATNTAAAESEKVAPDVVEVKPAATAPAAATAPSVQNTYTNADLTPALPKPRPRKGLMIAGWSVLGGGYLFSVVVGLLVLAKDDEPGTTCLNCDEVGPKLMIPLVGPFMAIPDADGADGKSVAAILGVVQLTGLTLGIVGTALYIVRKKQYYAENQNPYLPRIGVAYTGRSEDSPILQLGWSF
jgi:hypothetical protein